MQGMLRRFSTKHSLQPYDPIKWKRDSFCLPLADQGKCSSESEKKENKCKDFAKLLSRFKGWFSQLLSDQEDRKKNSRGCLI
jgi:hypothetical protein